MGQKAGEKWTAAAKLQPTFPKSDRLLAPLTGLGQQLQARIGDTQGLSTLIVPVPLQVAGSQQIQLDHVLAGPARRTPKLTQPAPMRSRQARSHGVPTR